MGRDEAVFLRMATVLGIDAAWTPTEPSGVALLTESGTRWRCVAVAPDYSSFAMLARGAPVDWTRRPAAGGVPDVPALLAAARSMAGADVDLIAIDMPVGRVPFTGRRAADNQISSVFGGRGCSAHSPTADRPGALGAALTAQLVREGYRLRTQPHDAGDTRGFIEVYPHAALLALLGAAYRVPYKVQKSSRYWPELSVGARIGRLLDAFERIDAALRAEIDGIPHLLPARGAVGSLASLKRHEDALDALICGWVGAQVLRGHARPYGDETAAVWVPDRG